jgi:hypothetical protein
MSSHEYSPQNAIFRALTKPLRGGPRRLEASRSDPVVQDLARSRWESGYAHTMRAIERHAWEDEPLEGMILHETEHS